MLLFGERGERGGGVGGGEGLAEFVEPDNEFLNKAVDHSLERPRIIDGCWGGGTEEPEVILKTGAPQSAHDGFKFALWPCKPGIGDEYEIDSIRRVCEEIGSMVSWPV